MSRQQTDSQNQQTSYGHHQYGQKDAFHELGQCFSGRNFLFSEKHTAKQREKSILLVKNSFRSSAEPNLHV